MRTAAISILVLATSAFAQNRTVEGHPDLQGIWSNASIIPLERVRVCLPRGQLRVGGSSFGGARGREERDEVSGLAVAGYFRIFQLEQ